jgi:hypothetical protein
MAFLQKIGSGRETLLIIMFARFRPVNRLLRLMAAATPVNTCRASRRVHARLAAETDDGRGVEPLPTSFDLRQRRVDLQ